MTTTVVVPARGEAAVVDHLLRLFAGDDGLDVIVTIAVTFPGDAPEPVMDIAERPDARARASAFAFGSAPGLRARISR